MDEIVAVSVVFPVPVDRAFTYLAPAPIQPGCRVLAPFGKAGRTLRGVVIEAPATPPPQVELKPVSRVLDTDSLWGEHTLALARWMADHTLCSLGEALGAMLPSARREKEPPRLDSFPSPTAIPQLSGPQRAALEAVVQGPGKWFYLRGQTGSGKTEVFFQMAEAILARGEGVIFLVPEINLTHQLVDEARRRFGEVAVLHSGLTPSQRLQEWRRLQRGQARIVLGARSAIFAPVPSLGLILIDEEPEASYKSQAVPRYHARSVAFQLSRLSGARLVMASATPSLEALKAIQEGTLIELRLGERLSGGAPPRFHVLDSRQEQGLIAAPLAEAILETHRQGRQTVILLNRRGYTYLFHCLNCHYELNCPNCSVCLTYHKSRGLVICHHCGYSAKPPTACPQCGSYEVGWAGYGIELAEQELHRLFPQLRIVRLDSDSALAREKAGEIIRGFTRGDFDLLIGTQMISKGLNFPRLKTVGILNADVGLSLPDFRAAERVYALIRQTAGRAGRFSPDGEVFLQTYRPDYWVIQYAAQGLDERFHASELALRRQLGLPPYNRLLRVVVRHASQPTLLRDLEGIQAILHDGADPRVVTQGPAPCPMERLEGSWRYHFLLKAPTTGPLRAAGQRLLAQRSRFRSTVELDLDPVHIR